MWYPGPDLLITPVPKWKLAVVHWVGKALGIVIKYEGWPLGRRSKAMEALTDQMMGDACKAKHGL